MALLSHAVGRTERLSAWNEVFALVLLFAGTLLFFALISYTPKDIPSWFWFSHVSPANHPAQNFIGPAWSDRRRHLLSANRRFRFTIAGGRSTRIRRREIILSSIACHAPNPVDHSIPHFWCMLGPSVGDQPFPRKEGAGGHSRTGRSHRLSFVR